MNYNHFGVMLDCSRNAVATVDTIKDLIDHLAKMGYNMLELYTEDTYEVEGEPYFGYLRGRYSGAELKEIDAYAKEKGIELIPCIQTLAHFTNMVKHSVYDEIVDCKDILLIDEEKTYQFIDKLFASLAENFTSRLVNIGMDEAHLVGLGNYLKKHGYANRYEILIRHLDRVAAIAKKYGFKAHMWSDMFFRLACGDYYVPNAQIPEEVKNKLPENVELVYWDYYHTEVELYDGMFKTQAEFGKDVWFAGGAWSWFGFAPLNEYSLVTMKPAMESAVKNGVKDVFLTMWGDDGKECSFYSLLPSLYAIRQYADGNFDEEKIKQGFKETFGVDYDDFMLLDLPNSCWYSGEKYYTCNPSKALLYNDPFLGKLDCFAGAEAPADYAAHAEKLKGAAKRVGKKYSYLFTELAKLCEIMAHKVDLGIRSREAYDSKDKKALKALLKEYEKLRALVKEFHYLFKNLWFKENKAFGWEIHDARLGGVVCRLNTCKKRIEAYLAGKIDKIEELEEDILPIKSEQKHVGWNFYRETVSVSEL